MAPHHPKSARGRGRLRPSERHQDRDDLGLWLSGDGSLAGPPGADRVRHPVARLEPGKPPDLDGSPRRLGLSPDFPPDRRLQWTLIGRKVGFGRTPRAKPAQIGRKVGSVPCGGVGLAGGGDDPGIPGRVARPAHRTHRDGPGRAVDPMHRTNQLAGDRGVANPRSAGSASVRATRVANCAVT